MITSNKFGSVKQVMKTVDRPKESTASGTPLGPIMEGLQMEVKSKIEDIIEMTRINELLDKREAANAKKPSNVILWILAVLGAISAVAVISFLVYRYMTPAFEDDYYDDDFDDFEDDFEDEDFIREG
jgi:hypothetical protein